MNVGKYEDAIEVFESLYDYDDSVIKIESVIQLFSTKNIIMPLV